jgi:peptidoglycan hydrolase-like protein with peptidoglycan-binding domain
MARELALHLNALELSLGGPKNAKGHQNATLTRAFQKAAGLTVDNVPGPATFIAMARRGVGTLPLVMYWPTKADQKTVIAYRTALRAIASEAPKAVGDQLRASADRERGQGGIVGPLAPDTGVANPLDPNTKPNAGAPPKANA